MQQKKKKFNEKVVGEKIKRMRTKRTLFKDEIEMRMNTIPSAVVSASANTVGGVEEDEAATADVVVVKLKQPLSPADTKSIFFWLLFNLN